MRPSLARMLPALVGGLGSALLVLSVVEPGNAQSAGRQQTWTEEKCARYRKSWSEVLERSRSAGLGPDFIARHQAFVDGGCNARADVCPRTAREIEVANILTIQAMNAGMASTFLPFSCRE